MKLLNHTPLRAGVTLGMNPAGSESLVVVVKGSFSIPQNAEQTPLLLEEQPALLEADCYHGEAGRSSPLYESDFAPFKPRCDIAIVGSAHAPRGEPAERVHTGFTVGSTSKRVEVLGDRHWIIEPGGISISRATPFKIRPITYDIAFGGIDDAHEDSRLHHCYLPNPVGRGFHRVAYDNLVHGSPVPSTEEHGLPIAHPYSIYRPMAYGLLGRGWSPRTTYAGSYDDDWLDSRFPFLPDDFDPRYHQSAPLDQQCDYLQGGESVELINLTPDGLCRFQLPRLSVLVSLLGKTFSHLEEAAVMDTLLIEPDRQRFSLTWRVQHPLKRNLFEISEVHVGRIDQDFAHLHDAAHSGWSASTSSGPSQSDGHGNR